MAVHVLASSFFWLGLYFILVQTVENSQLTAYKWTCLWLTSSSESSPVLFAQIRWGFRTWAPTWPCCDLTTRYQIVAIAFLRVWDLALVPWQTLRRTAYDSVVHGGHAILLSSVLKRSTVLQRLIIKFGRCLPICTHWPCHKSPSPKPALPTGSLPNHIQLTQLMQTWQ